MSLFTPDDIIDQEFVRDLRRKYIESMSSGDEPPSGYDAERYLTALKDFEESTFKKASLKIRGASVVAQDSSNALLAELLNKMSGPNLDVPIDITPDKEVDDTEYALPDNLSKKEVLPGEDRIGSPSEGLYDEIFGRDSSSSDI